MKKLFVLIFVAIMMAGVASAAGDMFSFDNEVKADVTATSVYAKYPDVDIMDKSWSGEDTKLASFKIISHTEKCGGQIECYTEGYADMAFDGKLFESFRFIGDTPKEYTLYVEESYDDNISEYGMKCDVADEKTNTFKNCDVFVNGSHLETKYRWVTYDGKILKASLYHWKLTGKKEMYETTDWIGTTYGKELTQWATWTTANCSGVGGLVQIDGDYCVHTFRNNGTFNITWDNPLNISVFAVGAGSGASGGQGGVTYGSAGGGGNVVLNLSYFVSSNLTVTIGQGGLGCKDSAGCVTGDGGVSSIGTISAAGAKGFAYNSRTGGSTAKIIEGSLTNYTGGTGDANYGGGGGAGANQSGGVASLQAGGMGYNSTFNGTAFCVGGGGGANSTVNPTQVYGCGARGYGDGLGTDANATANMGGGGGGQQGSIVGGRGGSGIIFVRYLASSNEPPVTPEDLTTPIISIPNGGESYNNTGLYINFTHSSTTSQENKSIRYNFEFSNNSGSTWNRILYNWAGINAFNDSNATFKAINFVSAVNFTYYFTVNKYSRFLFAGFNITGKTANTLVYPGNKVDCVAVGGGGVCAYANDTDWSTNYFPTWGSNYIGKPANVSINYTINQATDLNVNVTYGMMTTGSGADNSVVVSCWNNTQWVQIDSQWTGGPILNKSKVMDFTTVGLNCNYSTNLQMLFQLHRKFECKLYETNIYRTIAPTDPWIEIGTPDGTREWNYTGAYTSNQNTSDLSSEFGTYLSSCTPNGIGDCNVPFTIGVSSLGGVANITSIQLMSNQYLWNVTGINTGMKTFRVRLNATDGVNWTSYNASAADFEINQPPTVRYGPAIYQDVLYNNKSFGCSAVMNDLDNQTGFVNFTWYYNGRINTSEVKTCQKNDVCYSTEKNGGIYKGDNVTCSVKINDGIGSSNEKNSSTKTVQNSRIVFINASLNTTGKIVNNEQVEFIAYWNDTDGDNASLFIANNTAFLNCNFSSQAGCLAYSINSTNGTSTANFTVSQSQQWYSQVCTASECDSNNVNRTLGEEIYPSFGGFLCGRGLSGDDTYLYKTFFTGSGCGDPGFDVTVYFKQNHSTYKTFYMDKTTAAQSQMWEVALYKNEMYSTNAQQASPRVFRYYYDGTNNYFLDNFSVAAQVATPLGLYVNESHIVVCDDAGGCSRYNRTGGFDIEVSMNTPRGVGFDGDYYWITDEANSSVWQVGQNLVRTGVNFSNWTNQYFAGVEANKLKIWITGTWLNGGNPDIHEYYQARTATGDGYLLLDGISPEVYISYPLNTTYATSPANITINATDLRLDTCIVGNESTNFTLNYCDGMNNSMIAHSGSNLWSLYANDTYGNLNATSVTFFLENIAPTVIQDSPANNTIGNNIPVMAANCNASDTNLDKVIFIEQTPITLHQDSMNEYPGPGQYTHAIPFWLDGDGVYLWSCMANDTYGNTNVTGNRTFILDQTPPKVYISYPANTTYTSLPSNITINATDSYLDTCIVGNETLNATIACNANYTFTAHQGNNRWWLYVNDSATNFNSTSVTFYVDTNAPNITAISPPNQTVTNTTTGVNITLTVNDGAIGSNWCYQETANISTACGGLNTGVYDITTWTGSDIGNLIDENWATYAQGSGFGTSYFYVNYTKPNSATTSSLWQVKDEIGEVNLTISSDCWSYDSSKLILSASAKGTGGKEGVWYCYNGTWKELRNNAGAYKLYEESMVWNIGTGSGLSNATLNIWNQTEQVNRTTIDLGGILSGTFGVWVWLTDGLYNWWWEVYDLVNNYETSETNFGNYTLTVDTMQPGAHITYPLNTTYNSLPVNITYNATDINANVCWITNESMTYIQATCDGNYTMTAHQGSNLWSFYVNDTANNVNSTSVTFFVHSVSPTIQYETPTSADLESIYTNYIPVNVSIVEASSYNVTISLYNDSSTLIDTFNGTSSPLFKNFSVTKSGNYTFNATTCDDYSLCASTATRSVNITGLTIGITSYNATTYGGLTEGFNVSITPNTGVWGPITGYLVWNGTAYLAAQNGNAYSTSIIIPGTIGTKNVYWMFTDGTNVQNSSVFTQTVNTISIDDCSAYGTLILNFSTYDEDTRTTFLQNGTVEGIVTLYPYGNGWTEPALLNYSSSHGDGNLQFCIDVPAITGWKYAMYYETKYYTNDTSPIDNTTVIYDVEYKFGQNLTLQNSTADLFRDIQLYPLKAVRASQCVVQLQDEYFIPIDTALMDIHRQYVPLNQYISVETPQTDLQGKAIGHFVANDVLYNVIVSKNNKVLYTWNNVQAKYNSPTDCSMILNGANTMLYPEDWRTLNNLSWAIWTNNRTIQMLYQTTDGSTYPIGWDVVLYDNYGNNTLCSTTVASSTGAFNCDVPLVYGNVTIVATPRISGKTLGTYLVHIGDNPQQIFGGTRVVLGIMMYAVLVMMFIADAIMIVVGAVLGVLFLTLFYFADGGSGVGLGVIITWFVVAAGIVIYQLSKKLNSAT